MISLERLTRAYGTPPNEVRALDDVSLEIADGEFVVVLGPSGSGKTTLLNIIGALDSPTSGTVRVAGKDITRASRGELFAVRRTTISFISQGFSLFPGLTARENVQFAIDASGRRSGPDAREVLESVGLGERIGQFPHQLSGGEQQRVAIARALATGNPILLADEPTGELDFHTGVKILELLKGQSGAGRAVVLVTHNRQIARAADRVVELAGGRIARDGAPEGGKARVADLYW